ncbi:MAG: O-antigen ligase family protein [Defluviitaleaceae bacterium]|nr:O-antigen ligase family protein [Defluviitaleaceae bacterium]
MPTKKLSWLAQVIIQWMEGSLFFCGLNAGMDWIVKLSQGSFIAGLFIGDDEPQAANLKKSIFVRISDKVLNGIPKPIRLPARWPATLSDALSGSWFVRTATDRLDTPIPPPVPNTGSGMVIAWGAFALPVWALFAVVIALPILPTMILAGILVPAFIFTLLSRRFVLDGTAVFLLLFIVVTLVAGVMSVMPSTSIPIAVLTSVFMLSTLLVTACVQSRDSVDLFICGFVIASAIAGVVGVYQIFVGDTTPGAWLDMVLFTDIGLRLSSTFGNANVYGTYLLLAIPVAAACIVYAKKTFFRICALGITGLLFINLLATYSRGCYVSLAIGAVAFVLIIRKQLIIVLIPALVGILLVLPSTVVNRLFSILNFEDTSTIFRLNIWRGSLRMLGDFWPIGIGQGEYAFNRVYTYYSLGAIFTPHSHNLFMQIFIETGIVGLLVFIGVLACFFRAQANFLRKVKEFRLRVFSAALIAAVVGFLAQGFFDHNFYNHRVLLTFFLLIGIGIAFTRAAAPKEEGKDIPQESEWVSGYHD